MEHATVRELKVEPTTPEAIAPFGQLLGVNDTVKPVPTGFYEGKVTVYLPVQFQSDADTELTLATVDRRDMRVQWMGRHFKHTQTFIPLERKHFVGVLRPPNDKDLPDLEQVRAFLFDGSCGFTMRIGTWHEFPFALVDRSNVIVILRRETSRNLRPDNIIAGEASGP